MLFRVRVNPLQLPQQPKAFLAAARSDHCKARPLQMPLHKLTHGRIVVHHEDQPLLSSHVVNLYGLRQSDRECLANSIHGLLAEQAAQAELRK